MNTEGRIRRALGLSELGRVRLFRNRQKAPGGTSGWYYRAPGAVRSAANWVFLGKHSEEVICRGRKYCEACKTGSFSVDAPELTIFAWPDEDAEPGSQLSLAVGRPLDPVAAESFFLSEVASEEAQREGAPQQALVAVPSDEFGLLGGLRRKRLEREAGGRIVWLSVGEVSATVVRSDVAATLANTLRKFKSNPVVENSPRLSAYPAVWLAFAPSAPPDSAYLNRTGSQIGAPPLHVAGYVPYRLVFDRAKKERLEQGGNLAGGDWPLGSWTVRDQAGARGRDIEELREIDLSLVQISSDDAAELERKLARQWIADNPGKRLAAVSVASIPDGRAVVVDGQGKALAQKELGIPALAWVSDWVKAPSQSDPLLVVGTDLTLEMVNPSLSANPSTFEDAVRTRFTWSQVDSELGLVSYALGSRVLVSLRTGPARAGTVVKVLKLGGYWVKLDRASGERTDRRVSASANQLRPLTAAQEAESERQSSLPRWQSLDRWLEDLNVIEGLPAGADRDRTFFSHVAALDTSLVFQASVQAVDSLASVLGDLKIPPRGRTAGRDSTRLRLAIAKAMGMPGRNGEPTSAATAAPAEVPAAAPSRRPEAPLNEQVSLPIAAGPAPAEGQATKEWKGDPSQPGEVPTRAGSWQLSEGGDIASRGGSFYTVTQVNLGAVNGFVRTALRGDTFLISSNERWGNTHGRSSNKLAQVLYLAAQTPHWQFLADAVARQEQQDAERAGPAPRPVLRNPRWTLDRARELIALEPQKEETRRGEASLAEQREILDRSLSVVLAAKSLPGSGDSSTWLVPPRSIPVSTVDEAVQEFRDFANARGLSPRNFNDSPAGRIFRGGKPYKIVDPVSWAAVDVDDTFTIRADDGLGYEAQKELTEGSVRAEEQPTDEPRAQLADSERSEEAPQTAAQAEGLEQASEAANPDMRTDDKVLSEHNLAVVEEQTTPKKPGKPKRPVWVVRGDTAPYRALLRDLGGHTFGGRISFWKDPTHKLANLLREMGRPTIEDRIAARIERSEKRAERYENRAQKATVAADQRFSGVRRIADMIPFGQPILVGHHSEGRARADQRRIETGMRKGVELSKKADYLANASDAASETVARLESMSLPYIGNRLKDARAALAKLEKQEKVRGQDARFMVYLDDAKKTLEFWQKKLADAGGLRFSSKDVRPGDRVKYRGTWFPVKRANRETVKLGNWLNVSTLTYNVPWAEISGHEPDPTRKAADLSVEDSNDADLDEQANSGSAEADQNLDEESGDPVGPADERIEAKALTAETSMSPDSTADAQAGALWVDRAVTAGKQSAQRLATFAAGAAKGLAESVGDSAKAFYAGALAAVQDRLPEAPTPNLDSLAAPPIDSPSPERRAAVWRKAAKVRAKEAARLLSSGVFKQSPTNKRLTEMREYAADAATKQRAANIMEAMADAIEGNCEPPFIGSSDPCLPDILANIDAPSLAEHILSSKTLYPASVNLSELSRAIRHFARAPGFEKFGPQFAKLFDRCGESEKCVLQSGEEMATLVAWAKAARKEDTAEQHRGAIGLADMLQLPLRLWHAGIVSQETYDLARNGLLALTRGKGEVATPEANRLQILQAEAALGSIPGYFPTLPGLADRLVREAVVTPADRVLEPSAGSGNIADAIRRAGAEPDVIETSPLLGEILALKHYRIVGEDFLTLPLDPSYDVVVQNPPFANGADQKHVIHAYGMLRNGGRLVSVVGSAAVTGTDKADRDFKDWLGQVGATVTDLPDGSFRGSLPSTNAPTKLITIVKGRPSTPKLPTELDPLQAWTFLMVAAAGETGFDPYHGESDESEFSEKLAAAALKPLQNLEKLGLVQRVGEGRTARYLAARQLEGGDLKRVVDLAGAEAGYRLAERFGKTVAEKSQQTATPSKDGPVATEDASKTEQALSRGRASVLVGVMNAKNSGQLSILAELAKKEEEARQAARDATSEKRQRLHELASDAKDNLREAEIVDEEQRATLSGLWDILDGKEVPAEGGQLGRLLFQYRNTLARIFDAEQRLEAEQYSQEHRTKPDWSSADAIAAELQRLHNEADEIRSRVVKAGSFIAASKRPIIVGAGRGASSSLPYLGPKASRPGGELDRRFSRIVHSQEPFRMSWRVDGEVRKFRASPLDADSFALSPEEGGGYQIVEADENAMLEALEPQFGVRRASPVLVDLAVAEDPPAPVTSSALDELKPIGDMDLAFVRALRS